MSLYTDDSSLVQATVPAQTDDKDPLQALSKALTQPAESIAQAQALAVAIERFEAEPARIPEIAAQLLPMVVEGGDSLLRTWTLDLVLLAVGRADLRFEVKVASGSIAVRV
jgi:symplekin